LRVAWADDRDFRARRREAGEAEGEAAGSERIRSTIAEERRAYGSSAERVEARDGQGIKYRCNIGRRRLRVCILGWGVYVLISLGAGLTGVMNYWGED
jgi:hypothetical protein